jgi:PEP-CTERM motif
MKRILIAALTVTATAALAAPASAAITFQGTTKGCFGAACDPTTASGPTASDLPGFLYMFGGFSNITNPDGTLYIGGGANDNLGKFSLTTTPDLLNAYQGDVFKLLVSFTLPGTTGNIYQAVLNGSVSNLGGSLFLDFDNTPILLTASDGTMFTLAVSDLNVTAGNENVGLQGTIRAVPEPATWALMILGFAGVGAAMRRSRKPALAQLA